MTGRLEQLSVIKFMRLLEGNADEIQAKFVSAYEDEAHPSRRCPSGRALSAAGELHWTTYLDLDNKILLARQENEYHASRWLADILDIEPSMTGRHLTEFIRMPCFTC
jgi:hypothetical protein